MARSMINAHRKVFALQSYGSVASVIGSQVAMQKVAPFKRWCAGRIITSGCKKKREKKLANDSLCFCLSHFFSSPFLSRVPVAMVI